jgi:hypothetical protein
LSVRPRQNAGIVDVDTSSKMCKCVLFQPNDAGAAQSSQHNLK